MGAITDPGEVNNIVLNRNKNYGGVSVLMTGGTGCGKTNALARTAVITKRRYKDVIIWRGKDTCQWSLFLYTPEKLILWLNENIDYKLFDRNQEKEVDVEKYFYKIKRWKTEKELVRNLSKNYINVIQTIPASPTNITQQLMFSRSWLRIMEELKNRMYKNWITFCFDEFEDMVPQNRSGMYEISIGTAQLQKEMRKNDINSYYTVHQITEIDWRVRNKVPWLVYLKGAKPLKSSKVYEATVRKLDPGDAVVEGTNFERFRYEFVGKDRNLRAIIKVNKKAFRAASKRKAQKQLKEVIEQIEILKKKL